MRAVLVVLALGVAAAGLYWFRPGPTADAKGPPAESSGIRFLERPDRGGRTTSETDLGVRGPRETAPESKAPESGAAAREPALEDLHGSEVASETSAPASAPQAPVEPEVFGLRASQVAAGDAGGGPGLAQALLFGRPLDVARTAEALGLGETEQRLYRAFSEALAGNRKEALETARGLEEPGLLPAEDRALLEDALGAKAKPVARAASSSAESPTRRAMRLKLTERDADRLLAEERYGDAARAYSELLRGALAGPWEAERDALVLWSAGLNRAQREHRWNPRGEWPSVEIAVEEGDSLTHVRKRFLALHSDGLVCTGQIERANQLTGFIHPGDTLRVPTERASVRVDLSSRWLLYLLGEEVAAAWEVGIGRDGQETIVGTFRVGDKQENPTWFKRGQEPMAYPDNPLGTRWIAWYRDGEKTGYGFHGTWEPESIGMAASDGCIRLRNEDVEVLFQILPVGAEVRVQE